jgi:hypothetical protein
MRIATVVMLSAFAGAAHAQTTRFVDGGVISDLYPYGNTIVAPNPGVTTAIGVQASNRWTVRFEATVPRFKTDVYECCSFGSGEQRTSYTRHRLETFSGFVGRVYPLTRTVTFTPLVGFGIVDERYGSESVVTRRDGTTERLGDARRTGHSAMAALSIGADMAVAVTSRMAIVPQIRMHIAPNYESFAMTARPGVALRVVF